MSKGKQITIAESLAKSYANKLKVTNSNIVDFERELTQEIVQITNATSERTVETLCKLFLDATYSDYGNKFKVMPSNNTNKIDFCILDNNIPVVLIEAKTLNSSEMCQKNDINKKALHQLIFYYLKERYNSNFAIKHLIATNGKEWFIFDAVELWKSINRKTKIETILNAKFNANQSVGTGGIYNAIEKEIISNDIDFEFVYFDLSKYNSKSSNDKKAQLFKILSPTHLLKIQSEESHGLDKNFYSELLYIMGLEESGTKKKTIGRLAKNKRQNGSFIELTIRRIREMGFFSHISNPNEREDAEYDTALQLIIVWINRILFLKLLEAQLFSYHSTNNDKDKYLFMKYGQLITSFDKLETMFSGVLNRPLIEREKDEYYKQYNHIPYLNSSLFEVSELEKKFIVISTIDNDTILNYKNGTRFSNTSGVGYNTLEYLLNFLDMYDFYTEAKDDIVDDNKPLIRANVLGLIFEKINGYKDGSYYTPGYITEYMCRETIRKTVFNKFAQKYNNINSFTDIKNLISENGSSESLRDYNDLINSITILDPAVGSGHFLVSALNELIVIKSELKILIDEDCRKLTSGFVANINDDELTISNRDGIFVYEVNNNNEADNEPQQIQKALFYQKKQIIENCLFGVDINPNSVNICRLRLWIELLKNCYYEYGELQTLPNIDINIKCGNSLISRYDIKAELGEVLKDSDITVKDYLKAVSNYINAPTKNDKRKAEETILRIKNNFRTIIYDNDPKVQKLKKLKSEIESKEIQTPLFELKKSEKAKYAKDLNKLVKSATLLEIEIEEIKSNEIYKNSLEWRFEFPEVLDEVTGDYLGFDVVIANPPYIKEDDNKILFDGLRQSEVYKGKMDIWYFFGKLSLVLLKEKGFSALIAQNNWTTSSGASKYRNYMIENSRFLNLIDFCNYMVFDSASIQTMISIFEKLSINRHTFNYRRILAKKPKLNDAKDLLQSVSTNSNEIFDATLIKTIYKNKYLTFNLPHIENICNKISNAQTSRLTKDEVANGIHSHFDFVGNKEIKKHGDSLVLGEGIFGLSRSELNNLNLTSRENELIKPYYNSDQIKRYFANSYNDNWIIYTDSSFKKPNSMNIYPNLKCHLDRFKDVISSDNKPYGLHRSRKENLFIGESIIALRKCSDRPSFTYTDFDCYVSATFNIIKTDRVDNKYLTGLLNSRLIEFWLRYKGKMQGSNYQLDQEPLINIPIMIPNRNLTAGISNLVGNILTLKGENNSSDISEIEKEIDRLVYELYELDQADIDVIEISLA